MTVAIVHDFLTQRGGAERVVLHLASRLRDPVIVTSCYAPDSTYPEFRQLEVRADHVVSGREAENFRRRALSYAKAFEAKDLAFADFVIVSASTFAHHVKAPRTLVYWYTPPRFLYDPGAYFRRRSVAKAFQLATAPHRHKDRKAARAHGKHVAVSARTARRLHSSYGIEADVLYPPFDVERFGGPATPFGGTPRALVVSRLLPYKRVDLAMAACAGAGIPLTVIGQGPDEARLRSLADPSVNFVSGVSEDGLMDAYDSHAVVLVPGIEDFGYIPLEAASRGRPVVAAQEGGAAETVSDGATGILVSGSQPDQWGQAIRQAVGRDWDIERMRSGVEGFGSSAFDAGLLRAVCAGGDEDLIECFVPALPTPSLPTPASAAPAAR